MFRRRRDREDNARDESEDDLAVVEAQATQGGDDGEVPAEEREKPLRPDGPWDAAEVDLDDADVRRGRLDLGALVVKGRAATQLRIDVDNQTRRVRSVTFVADGSGLQLQVFAAPRSTPLWPEIRKEIAADCVRRGGAVGELVGPYGKELTISLPVTTPDGKAARQSSRIVGVDGPRWLLRASFLGPATDPGRAGELPSVLRDVIVVRGQDPMAPRDALPLRMPTGPGVGVVAPVDGSGNGALTERAALSPFRRGPEITELH